MDRLAKSATAKVESCMVDDDCCGTFPSSFFFSFL